MKNVILLRFRGNKNAYAYPAGKYQIGKLMSGAVIDMNGVRIGSYRRIITDGGTNCDWQEIEITLEVEDGTV